VEKARKASKRARVQKVVFGKMGRFLVNKCEAGFVASRSPLFSLLHLVEGGSDSPLASLFHLAVILFPLNFVPIVG